MQLVDRERETSEPDIIIINTSGGNYHDNCQQRRQISDRTNYHWMSKSGEPDESFHFKCPYQAKTMKMLEMVRRILVCMGLHRLTIC